MTMIHLNTFSDALFYVFAKKNEKNYFSGSKNEFKRTLNCYNYPVQFSALTLFHAARSCSSTQSTQGTS